MKKREFLRIQSREKFNIKHKISNYQYDVLVVYVYGRGFGLLYVYDSMKLTITENLLKFEVIFMTN